MISTLATLSYLTSNRYYLLIASPLPSIGLSLYPSLFTALRSLRSFSDLPQAKSFFFHFLSFIIVFLSILEPYAKYILIAFFCTSIVTIFHAKVLPFSLIMLSLLTLLVKQPLLSDPLTTELSFLTFTSIIEF